MKKLRGNALKKRNDEPNDACVMFSKDAKDESYERYKKIQYRNLFIKAFIAFFLGLLFGFLIKHF